MGLGIPFTPMGNGMLPDALDKTLDVFFGILCLHPTENATGLLSVFVTVIARPDVH